MDIKVQSTTPVNQIQETQGAQNANDDAFKFTLMSRIEDEGLSERLNGLFQEIQMQGKKISKHTDVKDMKKYRALIKDFLNEIVNRSHKFSRENFLDRRGRHRVYGIIRLIDENLDELAKELMKEEQDNVANFSRAFKRWSGRSPSSWRKDPYL